MKKAKTIDYQFKINPSSKGNERPIMLLSYSALFKSNRFIFSTGKYAENGEWETSKKKKGDIKQDAIVRYADYFKDLGEAFKNAVNSGITNKEELKAILDNIKNPPKEEVQEENKRFDFLIEFAEDSLKGTPTYYNTSRGAMMSMNKQTVKNKKQAIERLRDFEKTYKYRLNFENVDQHFWKMFLKYLKDNRLSPGSRGRIVKDVKSFLNSAIKLGYTVNLDFKKNGIAPSEKSEKKSVLLHEEEIRKLAELDLKDRPDLINSRDWLLIACGTGLRHSDLNRLTEANIIDRNKIRVRTQKTGEEVDIPIAFDWLVEVLERRGWKFPKPITDQRLNTNLKVIAKLAGLNRIVYGRVKDYERKMNGEKEYFSEMRYVELHKVIGTHIGRRSFVTLMIKDGIPITSIAKMTGHKKLEILQAYEQMTPEENADFVLKKISEKRAI